MNRQLDWVDGLGVAVTVADAAGTIVAMNPRAREAFAAEGGEALIGSSLFACHPEPSRTALTELYARRQPNHYTIARGGQRKMIHQLPWTHNGVFAGFVELSLPIPDELPHVDRD